MTRWQRNLIGAAFVCSSAGLAFGYTLVRALVVVPVPASDPAPAELSEKGAGPRAAAAAGLTHSDLMLAVNHDPFQADRQRPPERYRMPGEEEPDEEEPPPPPPPPPFRVLGTIVTPDGGVAVIEAQNSVSRVVGVGESLFGFRLAAVNLATATVEGNDGRSYSLQIEPPAQTRSTRSTDGRGGRAGRGSQEAARERALETRERLLNEVLQRGRGRGASAEQLGELRDMLRRNFPDPSGIGNVEVIRGANGQQQIIIRPRSDTLSESSSSNRNR